MKDPNFGSLFDLFSVTFREPWVIQKFLPEVAKGDKRIILVDGEPLGAVNRVPAGDDIRSNMVRGGAAARDRADAARARDLRSHRAGAEAARPAVRRHRRDRRLSDRDQRHLADRPARHQAARRPRPRRRRSGTRSRPSGPARPAEASPRLRPLALRVLEARPMEFRFDSKPSRPPATRRAPPRPNGAASARASRPNSLLCARDRLMTTLSARRRSASSRRRSSEGRAEARGIARGGRQGPRLRRAAQRSRGRDHRRHPRRRHASASHGDGPAAERAG